MALLILTKEKVKPEDVIESIKTLSLANEFIIDIKEKEESSISQYYDVYISKDYKKPDQEFEDYFYLGLESNQMEFEVKGHKRYRLGVTDQAEYDHLMYDFSLGYLRLNPDHIVSVHDETFYTLKDIEKIESEGGYYEDWCFGVSRPK